MVWDQAGSNLLIALNNPMSWETPQAETTRHLVTVGQSQLHGPVTGMTTDPQLRQSHM